MSSPTSVFADIDNFLPETYALPLDTKEYPLYFKDKLEAITRNLNVKVIGSYFLSEQPIGKQYFGATPQTQREVYRKVFSFGAIAAGATLNIPHGITGATLFTLMEGHCITNVIDFRSIPNTSVTALNAGIERSVTATNIIITNGAGSPPITSGVFVLEYLKT